MPYMQVFPASAGVILVAMLMLCVLRRFPRIRGGDPGERWTTVYRRIVFPAPAGVILGDLL